MAALTWQQAYTEEMKEMRSLACLSRQRAKEAHTGNERIMLTTTAMVLEMQAMVKESVLRKSNLQAAAAIAQIHEQGPAGDATLPLIEKKV
jgi:hypothetical protein